MSENQTQVAPKVEGSFAKPETASQKENHSELLTRIYEVETYIAKLLKDNNELLATVLANQGKLTPVAQVPVAPVQSTDAKLDKIVAALAEYKNEKNGPALTVNATENNMFYIIKTTGFLGSDVFASVARKIKNDFGGEYVSQGKASHFRISKA